VRLKIAGAVVLICCADLTQAATPEDCRVLADDARRLACFDAVFPLRLAVGQPVAAPANPGAVTQAPASNPAPSPTAGPDPQFGFSMAQQRAAAGAAAPARAEERISARVTQLQRGSDGRFVVVLDNAQVWQQADSDWSVPPKLDERVTVRRGTLGSYMLETADKVTTRVRRLR